MGRNVYLRAKESRLFLEEAARETAFFRLETELPKAGGTSKITVAYTEVSGNFFGLSEQNTEITGFGPGRRSTFRKKFIKTY